MENRTETEVSQLKNLSMQNPVLLFTSHVWEFGYVGISFAMLIVNEEGAT